MNDNELRPKLDVDRERLREVVSEALRLAHEFVDGGFHYTDEQIYGQLDKHLACGLSAAIFRLQVGAVRYPDLVIRVDPKRREAMLLSKFKKVVARANKVLRAMV